MLNSLKLYAVLALVLALLGLGTTLYLKGAQAARQKSQIESLKDTVANQAAALTRYREAYSADQERARLDAEAAAALQSKVSDLSDYLSALKDRDSVCLAEPDTSRLRDLWVPKAGTSPADPKRP